MKKQGLVLGFSLLVKSATAFKSNNFSTLEKVFSYRVCVFENFIENRDEEKMGDSAIRRSSVI